MSDDNEPDPRARWRALPERSRPEEWVTEHNDHPVPGAIEAADLEAERRRAALLAGG
ncbi:hypothetical protein [Solihabitans fulvus]|uniref:hypothetical protein n=1 Tax=Solihabitans fulvus TaxID=1892852 RepID=UPI001661E74F|nr:hypothetical protein [Solihabitans fulvus]